MSKKDYELIADTLYHLKPHPLSSAETNNLWLHIVNRMANALQRDNSAFNTHRFTKACGA